MTVLKKKDAQLCFPELANMVLTTTQGIRFLLRECMAPGGLEDRMLELLGNGLGLPPSCGATYPSASGAPPGSSCAPVPGLLGLSWALGKVETLLESLERSSFLVLEKDACGEQL